MKTPAFKCNVPENAEKLQRLQQELMHARHSFDGIAIRFAHDNLRRARLRDSKHQMA